MSQPRESAEIADLFIVDMDVNADERGRFIEVFRKEWFPQPSWKSSSGAVLNPKLECCAGCIITVDKSTTGIASLALCA